MKKRYLLIIIFLIILVTILAISKAQNVIEPTNSTKTGPVCSEKMC